MLTYVELSETQTRRIVLQYIDTMRSGHAMEKFIMHILKQANTFAGDDIDWGRICEYAKKRAKETGAYLGE